MSNQDEAPDKVQEALEKGQAAIVFDADGDYTLYVPKKPMEADDDSPVSQGLHLMALCISLLNSEALQQLALLRLKAVAAEEEKRQKEAH
jgi:hypothetical protein